MSMHDPVKSALAKRLSRIEGQVRGVAAMVADDRYCMDVLTQIQAIKSALRKVEDEILKSHASHCVASAIAEGDAEAQQRKFGELVDLLGRYRA